MVFYLDPIPGNPAFGKLTKRYYSSDYTETLRRRRGIFRNRRMERLLVNREKLLITDKSNLIANLYYIEDLKNVYTLTDSSGNNDVLVNPDNTPLYLYYNLDPIGQLFGRSFCGTNNFTNYMRLKPFGMKFT